MANQFVLVLLLSCGLINAVQSLSAPYPHEPCDYDSSVDLTNATWNSATQRYDLDSISYGREHYREFNFTVLSNGTEVATAKPYLRGCICQLRPCVRSCCPTGKFQDYSTGMCTATERHLDFQVNVIQTNGVRKAVNFRDAFVYVHGKIKCAANELLAGLDPDDDTIDEKWELYWNGSSTCGRKFCIDVTAYGDKSVDLEGRMFVCEKVDDSDSQSKNDILRFGMLSSIPFLVITFIVYAVIPGLRNLNGKCLMSYVFALTVVYISLSLIYVQFEAYDKTVCEALGFTVYFSFIASILWVNVMCIDIWLAFRYSVFINKQDDNNKFRCYSTYTWGLSLVALIIVLVMNYTEILPKRMRPQIGDSSCFLKNSFTIQLVYLYIPFMIAMSVNIILFVMTARNIKIVQAECNRVMSATDSRRHAKARSDRNRFALYLRLFVLMGIMWILEIVTFVFQTSLAAWILKVVDFCNCIHGVMIFCLLVMTKKNQKIIKRQLCGLERGQTTKDQSSSFKFSNGASETNDAAGNCVKPNEFNKCASIKRIT